MDIEKLFKVLGEIISAKENAKITFTVKER